MLADALVSHHSGRSDSRNFWDRPPVVTSVLIQGYDNRGLVLLCVYVFSILWISIKNGLYHDWHHHSVPSGDYTNQLQVSWGAKFKLLLNVKLNNFIIEYTTETKILLLVPLDHRNIFHAHWDNLKSPDLAFKYCLHHSSYFTEKWRFKVNIYRIWGPIE
jgi:hypothetical protein